MLPFLSAENAEFAPEFQRTSSSAGGSLTMVMRTSDAAATSRGDAASFAPAATRESARDAVRFQTVRGKPALTRLWPMGFPMRPRPMSPTVGCDTDSSKDEEEDCNGIGPLANEDENLKGKRGVRRESRAVDRGPGIRPV